MTDDEMLEAMYWEVHDLLEIFAPQLPDDTQEYLRSTLPHHEGLVVSDLLWRDAQGELLLPDETVARLWEIGYAYGCDADFLLDAKTVAAARPGRRTRPPQPVARPLSGGGHGPGRAAPGKREFPARWSDDDTMAHTMDVAQHPSTGRMLPSGDYLAGGERDGVEVVVLLSPDGEVVTAYPAAGLGVVENPLDAVRAPHVAALQELLDETVPGDEEPRPRLDELMAVGEWPHVVRSLGALGAPADRLTDLRRAAGLPEG